MLSTTQDIYLAFLDGIKKESTSVVTPFLFNRLINEWGQDLWLADKVTEIELNQKRIDDLEVLRVVTDGVYTWDDPSLPAVNASLVYSITPDTTNGYIFTLPKDDSVAIPNTSGTNKKYPKYYRFLNVMFKIMYVSDSCGRTGESDWQWPYIMRSDNRATVYSNPYRKPTNDRLYYEIVNGKIRVETDTTSYPTKMRLEYIRWPHAIWFDSTAPTTESRNFSHTAGQGCVNCELPEAQKREIVDVCVRTYLERVKDPRYQSFLLEERIKAEGK